MPSERSSAGDPARTLELLWRDAPAPSRRGPQRGLQLDDVVAVATGLADREGLQAVTMRRVAQALEVVHDDALHLRPGQGRAAGPDARCGLRADAARRQQRAAVAAAADGGRGGEPGAVRRSCLGRHGVDPTTTARSGADGQVRARACSAGRTRPRRRRDGRRTHLPVELRASRRPSPPPTPGPPGRRAP